MTTAATIVDRAFRRIGVKSEGENLTADQAAHGLDVLNSLLASLRTEGVNYTHAALDHADPISIADDYIRPVVALLAIDLGPDYGVPVQDVREIHLQTLRAGLTATVPPATFDAALLRRSPNDGWRY